MGLAVQQALDWREDSVRSTKLHRRVSSIRYRYRDLRHSELEKKKRRKELGARKRFTSELFHWPVGFAEQKSGGD